MSNPQNRDKIIRIQELLAKRKNTVVNLRQMNNLINPIKRPIVSKRPKQKLGSAVFVPKVFSRFKSKTGVFKHSGDIGDLWYSLPVVRYLGGGNVFLNPKGLMTKKGDGTESGFNPELIKLCVPLLEAQSYINKADAWSNQQIIVDLDYFRHSGNKVFNLCEKILNAFSVPFKEVETPWISCDQKKVAKYVFARSMRYRNEDMDYKNLVESFGKDAIFIGLKNEHDNFTNMFGKIDYYPVKDFLEMAEVINGSECFIGNQSSPMALAIAMHKNFIQECFRSHPDCMFTRSNAQYCR